MSSLVSGSSRIVTGNHVWLLADPDLHAIRRDHNAVAIDSRRGGPDGCLDLPGTDRRMLTYTITGNPIVKKNTQKVVRIHGRPTVVYSSQYRGWLNNALDELEDQAKPDQPVDYPVLLVCKFFMQTLRIVDLSALYEGIQDTLVKAEILKDDNFNIIIGHDGSRVLLDRENPRIEVAIVPA